MTSPSPVPVIPMNPDGSFNPSQSVPVGNQGQTTIWSIPSDVLKYEQSTMSKPFLYETADRGYGSTAGNPRFNNPQFEQANSTPGSGNQYTDAQTIMSNIAAMAWTDPGEFQTIQEMLSQGSWGRVKVTGRFDSATEKALGNAMSQYLKVVSTGVPVSFTDYIKGLGAPLDANGNPLPNPSGGSSRVRAIAPLALANPDDLKNVVQGAAMQALGHAMDPAQVQKFIDAFQEQQRQAYEARLSGESPVGGEYVSEPNPTSAAIDFAKQNDPHGYDQNMIHGYANALLNDLLSGSPRLPDTSSQVNNMVGS